MERRIGRKTDEKMNRRIMNVAEKERKRRSREKRETISFAKTKKENK